MDLLDSASRQFERVVRQLPADAWMLDTPSQMTVRALVEHVVVGNRFTALLLTGVNRDAARNGSAARPLGDDPLAAVTESAREQSVAFAGAPPQQLVPGPQKMVTAAAFLRFRLVDLVVHAWDLLRAAGLDETLDPAVVRELLEIVEPHLPQMLATGAYGMGPSGRVGTDAPLQTLLLDRFGRRS